jgi:hypothetical protein
MFYLKKRGYFMLGGALLLASTIVLAASNRINRTQPVTLPDNTAIHVTLNQTVASDLNRSGDHFAATVSEPIVVSDKTVIPRGAAVEGVVIDAHESGRLKGRARLRLALESVTVDGKSYNIRTGARTRVSGNHKKRNFAFIGGGAGGGALIGALAGGGKGALIGLPVGAGAGTAAAFITGKKNVRLPTETPLTFTLAQPVTIDHKG